MQYTACNMQIMKHEGPAPIGLGGHYRENWESGQGEYFSRKNRKRIDRKSAAECERRGLVTIIGLALIYFSGSTKRGAQNKSQFG